MNNEIQLHPGDIVGVTPIDGFAPIAHSAYGALCYLNPQKEHVVVKSEHDFVEIAEKDDVFQQHIYRIHKIFLYLAVRMEDRESIDTFYGEDKVYIRSFDKGRLRYDTLASISKQTPIEALKNVISQLQRA